MLEGQVFLCLPVPLLGFPLPGFLSSQVWPPSRESCPRSVVQDHTPSWGLSHSRAVHGGGRVKCPTAGHFPLRDTLSSRAQ